MHKKENLYKLCGYNRDSGNIVKLQPSFLISLIFFDSPPFITASRFCVVSCDHPWAVTLLDPLEILFFKDQINTNKLCGNTMQKR